MLNWSREEVLELVAQATGRKYTSILPAYFSFSGADDSAFDLAQEDGVLYFGSVSVGLNRKTVASRSVVFSFVQGNGSNSAIVAVFEASQDGTISGSDVKYTQLQDVLFDEIGTGGTSGFGADDTLLFVGYKISL